MKPLVFSVFVLSVVLLSHKKEPVRPYIVEECYYNNRNNTFVYVCTDMFGDEQIYSDNVIRLKGDTIK